MVASYAEAALIEGRLGTAPGQRGAEVIRR
jgi:hypothetical protein